MPARLEEQMSLRRQFRAYGSKQLGPELPKEILDQITAAITADDRDAIRLLLDEYFSDRNQVFPGKYNIHELFPALSQAARSNQTGTLEELFVPYPFPFQTANFVAREAIDAGSKNTLLLLLKNGWDINKRIDPGLNVLESLLQQGAQDQDAQDMVLWLIAHGAGLNERPWHKDITGMSQAVENASPDLVRRLLDNYGGDVHRGQLLHYALQRRPAQVYGETQNSKTGSQSAIADTAATSAASNKADDIVDILDILLQRGAPLNQTLYANDEVSSNNYRSTDHGTPLHEAARMGLAEAVRFLLSQGADTSIVSTKSKTTPLEWAEKAGHTDVARMLRSPDEFEL